MAGCPRAIGPAGRRVSPGGAALLLLLLLPISAAAAMQAEPIRLQLDSTASRVWFEGSATLGDFTAESRSATGTATLDDPTRLTSGHGRIELPVASLKTGNGLRNKHLRDEMEASKYPLVVFTVERVLAAALAAAPSADAEPGEPVLLHGTLEVKGRPTEVDFPATAELRGDTLLVRGRMPLRFTRLGMKPPVRLLGATKVRDEFTLAFDARFIPAPR
ncbi:MAG TPA: YceI family protein [Longimicrobiales bacterium]|nr:YceI family protein [Longimicrobiales bacterium]